MNTISTRIQLAIKEANLSYGEISHITGIPKSALHRYATGITGKCPLDRIESIAKATGVSPAYLMGWEDSICNTTSIDVTPHEQEVITQYRAKPHLQEAVDKLLDVPAQKENPLAYGTIAACGGEINKSGKKKTKIL